MHTTTYIAANVRYCYASNELGSLCVMSRLPWIFSVAGRVVVVALSKQSVSFFFGSSSSSELLAVLTCFDGDVNSSLW